MTTYFAIALGGAFGAVCRFWISTSTYRWLGTDFPFGTLMVNISGSFLMGFLVIVLTEKWSLSEELKMALLVKIKVWALLSSTKKTFTLSLAWACLINKITK